MLHTSPQTLQNDELGLAAGAVLRAATSSNGLDAHYVLDQREPRVLRGAPGRPAAATLHASMLANRSLRACGPTGASTPWPGFVARL